MDRDAVRQRIRADMETEFLPEPSPDTLSQADRRMVNAAEYIAYHLRQIDQKLDRLIVLLEASAQTTASHLRSDANRALVQSTSTATVIPAVGAGLDPHAAAPAAFPSSRTETCACERCCVPKAILEPLAGVM